MPGPNLNSAVIRVEHLRKTYGRTVAVDDIGFEVDRGEVFGIIGPNGAGKTTTIECLEGLRTPDRGRLEVMGLRPGRDRIALSHKVGVQIQQAILPTQMRVWEALDLFASFYPRVVDLNRLIEQLELCVCRNTAFIKLSGGQRQRLFIALALIHDPEVVFLDEVTTGLDPQGRRVMWDLIRSFNGQGKTILLTTHFMEEAERLCHRVAVMDRGRIIALDSPENLVQGLGVESKIVFSCKDGWTPGALRSLPTVRRVEVLGGRATVLGLGERFIVDVVNFLTENRIPIVDFRTEQPNLDDVFLKLTGRRIRD
jgi:ABC-2 type transport system ATP-binding protein